MQTRWRQIENWQNHCAEGHEIPRGQWGLYWPWDPARPRFILCEAHALEQGYARPGADAAGMEDEIQRDVKRRQAGEE